jgi:hypothetical protein
MRLLGIVMVVLGALSLGYQGITFVTRESADGGSGVREQPRTLWVPPVVGGIVTVTGLLLVASDETRRGEA